MPREASAYLVDIIEACAAIAEAIGGLDLGDYASNRLLRSAVERECIIIGEAVAALGRRSPEDFESITNARRIVDFRNLLTHEYATVDDAIVWAVAVHDIPVLGDECTDLLAQRSPDG
jgi:uncharacterized protein with HEPN domain